MTQLTYEEWVKAYRPMKNPFDPNASFDGIMFETHGKEVEYVKSVYQTNPAKIWTFLVIDGDDEDGDDEEYPTVRLIVPDWHFVNRIGYFVSKVEWTNETPEIRLNDD